MTDFDPTAVRATLDQLEAMWRDTIIDSTIAVARAARQKGASDMLADGIAQEYLGSLIRFMEGETQ